MTLSNLINEHRAQLETFTALHRDDMSFDDEAALEAATFGPSLTALENPPAVASREDAIAALELVIENDAFATDTDAALVRRVLDYLKD